VVHCLETDDASDPYRLLPPLFVTDFTATSISINSTDSRHARASRIISVCLEWDERALAHLDVRSAMFEVTLTNFTKNGLFTPLGSMLLDKYLHNRTRLKYEYKYVNFYCEKVSDIIVTFRNYVITELNRLLTLDTGESRPLIGQHTSFSCTVLFGKKCKNLYCY
jgi:hypothetical protein